MEHTQHMFMFDNVSGWVDENPPFSDYQFVVSVKFPDLSHPVMVELASADEVDTYLDELGAATDE